LKILVANLGSTSLKWRLFGFTGQHEELLHKGGIERVTDYAQAIEECVRQLTEAKAIRDICDLAAVGFKTILARGVDGCVSLDESVVKAMEVCNPIAPAHNPPYITGIRLFAKRIPEVPLIGLFETAFYQWTAECARRYAVPDSWNDAGVRRWGFHGASHKFIAERSAELLGREDVAERSRQLYLNGGATPVRKPGLRVISCHLGGSSSITGIRNGVAIGNSMGLSPQSGLPHNNRVGDLDSFAIPFMMRASGLSLDEVEKTLCRESGLKALSGGHNDIRDIETRALAGDARSQLALDVLAQQARHWIGAYFLELNGADALVFTAGIGENRTRLRQAICADLDQLGIVLDPALNDSTRGAEGVISAPSSRVKVMVIPTNEELVVAREVKRFLEKRPGDRQTCADEAGQAPKTTKLPSAPPSPGGEDRGEGERILPKGDLSVRGIPSISRNSKQTNIFPRPSTIN
jgi:acetate kinase